VSINVIDRSTEQDEDLKATIHKAFDDGHVALSQAFANLAATVEDATAGEDFGTAHDALDVAEKLLKLIGYKG
jgi:hypothetical protein